MTMHLRAIPCESGRWIVELHERHVFARGFGYSVEEALYCVGVRPGLAAVDPSNLEVLA